MTSMNVFFHKEEDLTHSYFDLFEPSDSLLKNCELGKGSSIMVSKNKKISVFLNDFFIS